MTAAPPLTRREAQESDPTERSEDASTSTTAAVKREKAEQIGRTAAIFIMPLIIVGMLLTGYLSTMASPTAENMPVVVTGSTSEATAVRSALQDAEPEALEVDIVDDVHTARQMVYDREASAAVVVDGSGATVYTASGGGTQQVNIVTGLITPTLLEEGLSISSEDLAPLPESDPTGLGVVFLTIAIVMAGYLPFSVLRSNSPELLAFRRIVPLIAAWAALIAALVWTVTGPILDVVDRDHTVAVLGIAWLGVFAIASVQMFIVRLFGALGVIFGMLFLMVLGMPSSNMAMPVSTMPGVFSFLHSILPMPAIGEALRSVLYFDGAGVTGHLLVLAIGAVAGLLATTAFDYVQHRRKGDVAPLGVNVPSLHGGRRPDSKALRYISLAFFPLAMVTMLITFMLGAMHSPAPREMPVAVVSVSAEQADQTITGLEQEMGDMFDFTSLTDEDEARALVGDRDIVAALVLPTQTSPGFTLIANQAGNASAFQVVDRVFSQVASAQDMDLVVDDVSPLPDRDPNGVVVMYLAIGWTLAGFLVVIVGANANPRTRPLQRMLPLTTAYAVFMSAVVWVIAAPLTGAVEGHFLSLWGAGIVAIFCVAMFAMVLERLIGMLAVIPAIGILIFAGVPSSNGALSEYMTPGLFATLHDYLPMAASVETIRSILYFDGDVATEHLQVLGVWGLASLALVFVIDSLKKVRTEHDFGNLHLERAAHAGVPATPDPDDAAPLQEEVDESSQVTNDQTADEQHRAPAPV